MDKGIYTAVSGAMAQNQKLEVLSNNIANLGTVGFKKDEPVFKEYITALERQETVNNVPKVEFRPSDFYHLYGNDKSYVSLDNIETNFEIGNVRRTANPLDFVINGDGFFEVNTPLGLRYTRAGNFTQDARGRLVTEDGYPVLSPVNKALNKVEPEQREIMLLNADVVVAPDGTIFSNGRILNRLNVVEFENKSFLRKAGRNLFSALPEAELKTRSDSGVKQGFLEGSNVNPVKEMVELISTTRVFDGLNNAIKTYSEMAGKGVQLADINQ